MTCDHLFFSYDGLRLLINTSRILWRRMYSLLHRSNETVTTMSCLYVDMAAQNLQGLEQRRPTGLSGVRLSPVIIT